MEQQISSGFADSPKSMFLRLPAFAPSPCDATCFFGRAGFFTKKKRIQPGLEVSKLPKNPKKNIGKKQIQQKGKTHFSWEMFQSGRSNLETFSQNLHAYTSSELVKKNTTRMKKNKNNPNLPIPGDAKIGA